MSSVIESYRGSFVRVFRLDRERCLAELRSRATAIAARRRDVEEIRLFGSLARGDARPGSDADVLVILRDSREPFLERSAEFRREFSGIGVACDVFVYTRAEFERLRAERNPLVLAAEREGVVLGEDRGRFSG